jgi:ATP-GRASP peptide maturase of grasp-with-spasm system
MVIILSNSNDDTTNDVLMWLDNYGVDFVRINETDLIELISIDIDKATVKLKVTSPFNSMILTVSKENTYWYRRGNFAFSHIKNILELDLLNDNDIQIDYLNLQKKYLKDESNYISNYIHNLLKSAKNINSFQDNYLNKLEVLNLANDFGLCIPSTIITTSLTQLESFMLKFEYIISKPVYQVFKYFNENEYVDSLTKRLGRDELVNINKKFFPTLFQEYINKNYELRIFYLNDQFFASAIFSQSDDKTQDDFRRYNSEKPNRVVPYSLPNEIKLKLVEVFKALNINCGSVDMAVNKNGDYIFFEINPIGQIQQVSKPCNYYLEKIIADALYDNRKFN